MSIRLNYHETHYTTRLKSLYVLVDQITEPCLGKSIFRRIIQKAITEIKKQIKSVKRHLLRGKNGSAFNCRRATVPNVYQMECDFYFFFFLKPPEIFFLFIFFFNVNFADKRIMWGKGEANAVVRG